VREKAAAAMIDERTAAWELVKDLELWKLKRKSEFISKHLDMGNNVRSEVLLSNIIPFAGSGIYITPCTIFVPDMGPGRRYT
jgi:hypothetical protein